LKQLHTEKSSGLRRVNVIFRLIHYQGVWNAPRIVG
jgi:hypothetical protein